MMCEISIYIFFFNDTATTEIYTLSLHDALPISRNGPAEWRRPAPKAFGGIIQSLSASRRCVRESRPLKSCHSQKSNGVFCLDKRTTSRWNPGTTRLRARAVLLQLIKTTDLSNTV